MNVRYVLTLLIRLFLLWLISFPSQLSSLSLSLFVLFLPLSLSLRYLIPYSSNFKTVTIPFPTMELLCWTWWVTENTSIRWNKRSRVPSGHHFGRRWELPAFFASSVERNSIECPPTLSLSLLLSLSRLTSVAFAVTRICSSGQLTKCGCDRTIYGPAIGFQWAGCSDNAAFGTAFAKSFVDSKDVKNIRNKRTASKSLVNLHNNEVGRKVILSNMRIECKYDTCGLRCSYR